MQTSPAFSSHVAGPETRKPPHDLYLVVGAEALQVPAQFSPFLGGQDGSRATHVVPEGQGAILKPHGRSFFAGAFMGGP